MAVRTWLVGHDQDVDESGVLSFLLKITRENAFHGWQACDMSGVLDAIGDQMFASFIEELADDLDLFVLTDKGVRPVKMVCERHAEIGFLVVKLSWHDPKDPGKARVIKTGYVKIPGE